MNHFIIRGVLIKAASGQGNSLPLETKLIKSGPQIAKSHYWIGNKNHALTKSKIQSRLDGLLVLFI